MSADTESFNKELYDLLKVRGYDPVSKMWNAAGSKFNPGAAVQKADVFEFRFIKDGKDYGKVWASIVQGNVIIYYDDEQSDSPAGKTPGIEYDDSWLGFLTHVKNWAQGKQLSFELASKSRLGDDLKQREYYKTKEKLGEGKTTDAETCKRKYNYLMRQRDLYMRSADASTHSDLRNSMYIKAGDMEEKAMEYAEQYKELTGNQLNEGYYPMGKKASYNDAVPNVKIIIQHNRSLEEGEQRYRNVAKIFLENVDGERFLAPTTRPGIARVYARHIAEGGVPNDERWGHIKSICEEYNKMAGFVRATRGKQFNESAQALINEGANHYKKLRETLSRMTGHRGYNAYFESWTPTLMEDQDDDSINELFVQETVDPRIESVMPILSRLRKNVAEVKEVGTLAAWADDIINEKLELDEISKNLAQKYISKASQSVDNSRTQASMINYRPFGGKPDPEEWREYNKLNTAADKREKQISLARAKKNKSGETAPNYTPHAKAKIKATDSKNEKPELDEISKNLAQKYISKASDQADDLRFQAGMLHNQAMLDYNPYDRKNFKWLSPDEQDEYNKHINKAEKREKYTALARAKKNKSGETTAHYTPHAKAKIKATDSKNEKPELDEISKNLAQKYISKASKSADDLRLQQGMLHYNPWDIEDFELTPDEQDEYKNSKDKEEKREKMIALARAKKNKSGETTTHYTPYAKAKIKATDSKVEEDASYPWLDHPERPGNKKQKDRDSEKSPEKQEKKVEEDLDANQKRVGQLGPTERVKNNNIGKLVGANESTEIDPELARIIEMARFKR